MSSRNGRRRSSLGRDYVTRSGNSIKVNRSLSERIKARRDSRSRRKAARLSTLPKSRGKRILYRLQPKRLAAYWFSRDGAIMALKVVGIGIVVIFIFLVGLFAYFRKDLPQLQNISGSNLGGSISYYDRTGKVLLWQDYDAVDRIPVEGDQMSPYIRNATVAIEDKNFYHEGAFSITSYIRAALNDLEGNSIQGGSTITEQVVKLNENWTVNRTVVTKIKELILAVDLEREYSKDDILTGYLNVAPYGGIDYGVQAAAKDYFHTTAKNLTLAQSAFLAALPQAPSVYSPRSSEFNKTLLLNRQHYILDQMVKQGYITQVQANAAQKVNILAEVKPEVDKYNGIKAPYFVLAAKNELEQKYGTATVNRGGWKVDTTLNLQLQNDAQQDVANNLPNVEDDGGDEEAVVMEDVPTGQILAEVGGTNFNNPDYGQINYAQTNIPPGSSFKPYDYATLINDSTDVGAGSVLYDVKQPLPGYPCTNDLLPDNGGNCLEDYDFLYPGAESIRYALAGSRNVPAAKAMLSVVPNSQCVAGNLQACVPSINKVIKTADAMMDVPNAYQCYSNIQLTDPTQCYTSSAFGDGAYLHLDEHVNGDATLARLGKAIPNTYILNISNAAGKTIYKWTPPKPTQPVRTDAAYIVDNILSDPRASYLPGSCTSYTCTQLSDGGYKFQRYDGWDISVKTGTTNDNYDGLMTAWSTQFAVDSWVGYHTRQIALTAGQMEYLTEPLTRNLMEQGLTSLHESPINWKQPSDIKVLPAFVQEQHIDFGDEEPGPSTDLFPSWYVQPKGSSTTAQTIDKVSGDLATSCTPTLARETRSTSNANTFSADIFWPIGQSSTTSSIGTVTAKDDIHQCGDTGPSVSVTQDSCDEPGKCDFTVAVTRGTYALSGGSYTASPAGTVSLSVNGKTVETVGAKSNITFSNISVKNGDTVEATAVDSVLYSGSNSTTASNVPAATSPITLNSISTGDTTYSWTGGTGSYTVYYSSSGSIVCGPTSSTTCDGGTPAVSGGSYYVQDSSGTQSKSVKASS